MKLSLLDLGAQLPLRGTGEPQHAEVPAPHLVTHGVILGMTGSGKTGLATVLVEEALRDPVPKRLRLGRTRLDAHAGLGLHRARVRHAEWRA